MKIWKLVAGILSIVFSGIVMFQSCAAHVVNTVEEKTTDTSASGGVILAVMLLAGGIVSIATRKSGKVGNIAGLIVFAIAAVIGFANLGTYKDLIVWSVWCAICAAMCLIGVFTAKKEQAEAQK